VAPAGGLNWIRRRIPGTMPVMTSGPRRPQGGSSDAAGLDAGYAWVMLALGTVLVALNPGALSSLSVFLKPLSEEFGWPHTAGAAVTRVRCSL
jgi:hypothetical protein